MIKNNIWLLVRILLILISMISARNFLPAEPYAFNDPAPWHIPIIITLLVAAAIPFILSIPNIFRSPPSSTWHRPSWLHNPFEWDQPLLLFDLGAYCFLSGGVVCAITAFSTNPPNWAWEVPASIGAGMWIGVRVSMMIFRKQMEPRPRVK